jgi:hypothetical protein
MTTSPPSSDLLVSPFAPTPAPGLRPARAEPLPALGGGFVVDWQLGPSEGEG